MGGERGVDVSSDALCFVAAAQALALASIVPFWAAKPRAALSALRSVGA